MNEEILHNIRPILGNVYSQIQVKQNSITSLNVMNNNDRLSIIVVTFSVSLWGHSFVCASSCDVGAF